MAIGGVALGIIAIGGLGLGIISLGGLALGVLALGGLAVGGIAVGGGAIGAVAIGGVCWILCIRLVSVSANEMMEESNSRSVATRCPARFKRNDGMNDANVDEWNYGSALMSASQQGHTKVAQLLIERGANVNLGNKGGDSPLGQAAMYGHPDIANLLVENGADIDKAIPVINRTFVTRP
jgi:hypothetical protein